MTNVMRKGVFWPLAILSMLVLVVVPIFSNSPTARAGVFADYGDAPDDTLNPGNVFAYPGVVAHFPSVFDTTNSRVPGRKGAYNVGPFDAWLSWTSDVLSTTSETDAKLVDADEDDADPMLYIDTTTNDGFIVVRVVVAPTAPDVDRYINVLIDQNRDGEWRNEPNNPEWVGINQPVSVPPGEARNIIVGPIPLRSGFTLPVWTRISLTDEQIDPNDFDTYEGEDTFFEKNGWDGSAPSGGFLGGETEDWLFENSGLVPDTNLNAMWGGGVGVPPPLPLAQTTLAKAKSGEIKGITERWYKDIFPANILPVPPDTLYNFSIFISNFSPYPVISVTDVDIHLYEDPTGHHGLVDKRATIYYEKPAFPIQVKREETVELVFKKRWDCTDSKAWEEIMKKREYCPNGGYWEAWYDFTFTYDPPSDDPYQDEIESMNEPPPPPYFPPARVPVFPNWYTMMAAVAATAVLGYLIWRRLAHQQA